MAGESTDVRSGSFSDGVGSHIRRKMFRIPSLPVLSSMVRLAEWLLTLAPVATQLAGASSPPRNAPLRPCDSSSRASS
jgi:hypothetical protein